MRNLTLSQWNFLWSRGNGGCVWQGTVESEAQFQLSQSGDFREIVNIDNGAMFGIVLSARVDDLLEGRI